MMYVRDFEILEKWFREVNLSDGFTLRGRIFDWETPWNSVCVTWKSIA